MDINKTCIFVLRNRNNKAMGKPVMRAYIINVANDDFLISFDRKTAVEAMEKISAEQLGCIQVESVRGGFTPADITRIAVGEVVPAPDYALTWNYRLIAAVDRFE